MPKSSGREDDFSALVRRDLELKAGARCSAPFCRIGTSAAGSSDQVVRIGVAAHISAASPGGPRFDVAMPNDERRSSSNGIWLCQDHARLIDVDEARYPTPLLREWKRLAEKRPLLATRGENLGL